MAGTARVGPTGPTAGATGVGVAAANGPIPIASIAIPRLQIFVFMRGSYRCRMNVGIVMDEPDHTSSSMDYHLTP